MTAPFAVMLYLSPSIDPFDNDHRSGHVYRDQMDYETNGKLFKEQQAGAWRIERDD